MPLHPLSSDTWGIEERAAIQSVVDSGRFTMGPRTAQFEREYAAYVGTRYCVAVNSGSSANLLMVAAFSLLHEYDRRSRPKVIVPALGWSTSYSPFAQYGWQLIFVDIDRGSLNYDLDKLGAAFAFHQPDCILAINVLGNPNDFCEFPAACSILEDNCESMGAEYRGKKTGSFGIMASHSTFFSHHICTMEGGLVTTNDERYYQMLLSLRAHGWTRDLPDENVFHVKPSKFGFVLPGYNVRPTEMQCAIGTEQLKKLPKFIRQRRENRASFPLHTQREIGKSSWFGFAVFGDDRALVEDYESRPVISGNFTRHPAIKYYDHKIFGPLRNADYVHENAIMIGNSHLPIEWTIKQAA